MRILCLGISHKTAPVALRERFSINSTSLRGALDDLAGQWASAEFVVLSTCNRTEIYVARALHGYPRMEQLRGWTGNLARLPVSEFANALYEYTDGRACEHLFSVTAGLDSLIPGEAQIVAQVKDAYAKAVNARTARKVLNKVFQAALHAAKHVRSETRIGEGKVSVASAAIDYAAGAMSNLTGKRILSIGAGKMNQLMLRHLVDLTPGDIIVANRSRPKAASLARACGGRAVTMSDLPGALAAADVVLTSTASTEPVLTREMIVSAQRRRRWKPMLIVDLAVPRDVADNVGTLKNVSLYNIDDLNEVVKRNLKLRRSRRSEAERIVASDVAELTDKLRLRAVAPTIEALYMRMDAVIAHEIATARKKLPSEGSERDVDILRRALHRAGRRFLHPATRHLRDSAGTDAARPYIEAVRELFDLDRTD